MFDVYFGEPGTDEPVSANNGELLLIRTRQLVLTRYSCVKSAAIQTTEKITRFVSDY
jgi:hypothetical protein